VPETVAVSPAKAKAKPQGLAAAVAAGLSSAAAPETRADEYAGKACMNALVVCKHVQMRCLALHSAQSSDRASHLLSLLPRCADMLKGVPQLAALGPVFKTCPPVQVRRWGRALGVLRGDGSAALAVAGRIEAKLCPSRSNRGRLLARTPTTQPCPIAVDTSSAPLLLTLHAPLVDISVASLSTVLNTIQHPSPAAD